MRTSWSRHKDRTKLCQLVLVCVIVSFAGVGSARADAAESQRAAARELGTLGMEAYFDHDYARAADSLDRAYHLYPTPTLGLWSGRALIQLGHWVQAAERLREAQYASTAIGDNEAQRHAQADAANELASLSPRIPRLSIVVDGAAPEEVTIAIDNIPFDRQLIGIAHPNDPGHHRIVGLLREQRVEVEIELQPGASELARVVFEREVPVASPDLMNAPQAAPPVAATADLTKLVTPAPESATRSNVMRIAAISSLALGGAGLATSLFTSLFAVGKLDACEERGGQYFCGDLQADEYEIFRTAAAVTFYGGAAFAGAGLVLWLLQPSADKQESVSVSARPLGADVTLKF